MTFNNRGWIKKKQFSISTEDLEKAKQIYFKNGGKVEKLEDQFVVPLNHAHSKLADDYHRSSEMIITIP